MLDYIIKCQWTAVNAPHQCAVSSWCWFISADPCSQFNNFPSVTSTWDQTHHKKKKKKKNVFLILLFLVPLWRLWSNAAYSSALLLSTSESQTHNNNNNNISRSSSSTEEIFLRLIYNRASKRSETWRLEPWVSRKNSWTASARPQLSSLCAEPLKICNPTAPSSEACRN